MSQQKTKMKRRVSRNVFAKEGEIDYFNLNTKIKTKIHFERVIIDIVLIIYENKTHKR